MSTDVKILNKTFANRKPQNLKQKPHYQVKVHIGNQVGWFNQLI